MRVHYCIHNRTAEVFSRSSTKYFSCSLYCEVHVYLDSHHLLTLDFHHRADVGKFIFNLVFNLSLLFRLSLS